MLIMGAILGAAALACLALAGLRLLRAADLAIEEREDDAGARRGAGPGQGPATGARQDAAANGSRGGPDPAP